MKAAKKAVRVPTGTAVRRRGAAKQPPATEPESSGTTSTARTLSLLRTVAAGGRSVSLADLAAELRLPKATAHRLCAQLLESGFLARDVDERYFVVGPVLRRLAFDTLNHDSVRGLRHELLKSLVEEVGETCNFTTLDGGSVLYLDRVEAPWPWRLTLDPGAHVPLHCTASGKLFLALMPAPQREVFLAQLPLRRLTATTITDPKALRIECETIASTGYSVDRGEFIPGLIALAVPVLDGHGQARAAIAVHAPEARMNLDAALTKLPTLRDAAARMRGLL
jgi:DNA-binding IclR family transcriptional regulator